MYFNQFATMVIGGLWHGASWMYVIWGAIHGGLLVVHKMYRRVISQTASGAVVTDGGEVVMLKGARQTLSRWMRPVNMIVTFVLVSLTFMFFRAPSMEDVAMMWHQILFDFHLSVAPQFVESYLTIVLLMVAGYVIHVSPSSLTGRVRSAFESSPVICQAIILAVVILVVIQVRQSDIVPFIYLQY